MRTRNELYQAAMRTVSARRQMARAAAPGARAGAEKSGRSHVVLWAKEL